MRTKIDYGIDLGTTNSGIARIENGKPVIKKTDTLKDTMPSCVNFNKKQDTLVGDPAFNTLKNDSQRALKTWNMDSSNTFIEFKRTMGTDTKRRSSNMGRDFSSEELSAEVLMRLKSFIIDETIRSIVITVPAKFTMVQKDATVKAGRLAGFEHIELLQEPIAASMAYGLDAVNKDGIWLVFDFGGGTFDAALVKVEDGILKVMDTEGDNWLGGKNIDEAIADQIIIPYLQKNYSIEEVISSSGKKELLRNAIKFFAEDCKIQMSFKESCNILTDLGDLPFSDENGEEPVLDINVTQENMQNVVAPIFQKAVDICKDILKRNHLKGSQLDTIILVGGPTRSPILRRMLREQITERINFSIDPMTCVATGAALFASTIPVSDKLIEQNRDKSKIQLDIKHEATTVEMEEMVNIKILKDKTTGNIPEKIFAEILRRDKAWASGKKQIGEKASLIDVQLNAGTANSFDVFLYDEHGNRQECQPEQFTILQGIKPGQATLPYFVGVEYTDRVQEKDLLSAVKGLEKNKPLPATGITEGLKTQKDIRPGVSSDYIRIPIYQGDYYADGTTAIHSTHVNDVKISGELLPALLPAGSEVQITIKVDRSELMRLSIYFPYLNHTEEQTVEIIQGKVPESEWLDAEIRKAKKMASKLSGDGQSDEAKKVLNSIDEISQKMVDKGGSDSGKLEIHDNLLRELRTLDRLEGEAEWPKVEKKMKDAYYALEDLLTKIKNENAGENLKMEKIELHMSEFKAKIENIIKAKDVMEAKSLLYEMDQLDFALRDAASGGMMPVWVIQHINQSFPNIKWKTVDCKNKARSLLNQAIEGINNNKTANLRIIIGQIIDCMDQTDADEYLGKLTK